MKAHRTDGVSLTFALIFLVVAAWWLVAQLFDLALPAVGWFVAGALILLGVLGLFGALRSGHAATTGPTPQSEAPVDPPDPLAGAHGRVDLGTEVGADTEPITAPPAEAATDDPYRAGGRQD